MKLLEIQDLVRVFVGDSTFTIIDNSNTTYRGLDITNLIYRKLCVLIKWGELIRIDESIITVSGQASYKWIMSPVFADILSLELQTKDKYRVIPSVQNQLDWNHFSNEEIGIPSVYRRDSTDAQTQISFAPTPVMAGKIVRITGVIEPEKLINGTSKTVFTTDTANYALSYMIAAERAFKQNLMDEASGLIQKTSELLTALTGKEITPQGIDSRSQNA